MTDRQDERPGGRMLAGYDAPHDPSLPKPQCIATRTGRIDATLVVRCKKTAKYGDWCRQHAESLGGWRLAPPGENDRLRHAIEDFILWWDMPPFALDDDERLRAEIDALRAALAETRRSSK